MNCIDLFAGAGGLSEGFRRCGFNIIAHVEKEYSAALTLKTREAFYYLKENNMLEDYISYVSGRISREELYSLVPEQIVQRVINQEISDETCEGIFDRIDSMLNGEPVRVIIGGPPCQAYSLAGRSRDPQRMENDPRNYLYLQYIKFIERYRPDFFIFENVLGLLSARGGEIFVSMQRDMRAVGYNIDYRVLNACDFGVPQSRKRIILIGWNENINFEYPIFEKFNNNVTVNCLLGELPSLNAGESIPYAFNNTINHELEEIHINDGTFKHILQHVSRNNNQHDLEIYRKCVETWNNLHRQLRYNELPARLTTHNNNRIFLDRFKVVPGDGISHTIVAHIAKDGHYYIHPNINQNRSLSVREVARIQTFPDDYYFENSRTAAFTQIGNAVPPLMAERISEKILNAINDL